MIHLTETVNENIKKLRIANEWTQPQLAEKLGKKRDAIYRMEVNDTTINLKDAINLSELFGVSLDELVNRDIDANTMMETKKVDLEKYTVESLHPTLKKDFDDLPDDFKSFYKAMALEMHRKVTGMTVKQIKQETRSEFTSELLERLGQFINDEELEIDEFREITNNICLEIMKEEELL